MSVAAELMRLTVEGADDIPLFRDDISDLSFGKPFGWLLPHQIVTMVHDSYSAALTLSRVVPPLLFFRSHVNHLIRNLKEADDYYYT